MKKASEYRQHAKQCRRLASQMDSGEQREQLMTIGVQWERMAADRSALIRRHPELAREGEQEEEGLCGSPPDES